MRVVMLGSGCSAGVPVVGGPDEKGAWGRCNPENPRNRRTRASVLVEEGDTRILVDTGPDLRSQLLKNGIAHLTAVLYTHGHADHCHGIDDLRALYHNMHRQIPVYAVAHTLEMLETRFSYLFKGFGGYPPIVESHLLGEGALHIGPITVRPIVLQHGDIGSIGYRFDIRTYSMAYTTDLSGIPDESWPLLEGLDLWIVDALRRHPHPTHSHLAQTLGWADRARPKSVWLTHMDHSMDYDELLAELPESIVPGYDGLSWQPDR